MQSDPTATSHAKQDALFEQLAGFLPTEPTAQSSAGQPNWSLIATADWPI